MGQAFGLLRAPSPPLIASTLLVVLLVFASPACKRKKKTRSAAPESAVALLSVVNVADPAGAVQLASGFFDLESNTWRWTAQQFTVVLRPPEGAAERGARLELKLNLPDVIVNRIGPVTVSAEIGGMALAPERYAQAGDYVYSRDVEPLLLRANAVPIHFRTDKALTPTGADTRELALIVLSVGLVAK